MKSLSLKIVCSLACFALIAGCGERAPKGHDTSNMSPERLAMNTPTASHKEQLERIKKLYPDSIETETGVHYIVREKPTGSYRPSEGDWLKTHYAGSLVNGVEFDSSINRGKPFSFKVGMGQVIKGWDSMFLDMKEGEKRTIIIPSKMAYGADGAGKVIPPHSILIFEVELISIGG